MNEELKELMSRTGIDSASAEKLSDAAGSDPRIAKALGSLTQEDMDKISAVLSDREATARIMSSPKAQALLRMFGGGRR